MASKVGNFGRRDLIDQQVDSVAVGSVLNERVSVTTDMLNEAVEQTLEVTDPQHAHSLRVLWSLDSDHEAARMYFADQVRKRTVTAFGDIARFNMTIDEVLTQEQTNKIIEYAPEFNFTFRQSMGHDHHFFSARRKVDNQKLLSQFSQSIPYVDFGGSIIHAINMSQSQCLVVAPFDMDPKDATRWALTRLRLKQIAADTNRTPIQREMASSVLRGDGKYHVSDRAQGFQRNYKIGISNHVYDVPIEDWPKVMDQCDMQVKEGILHFSNDYFDKDSGEIEYSGAYFEIDRQQDLFHMRVGASSARWYTHKWSDYMRYGANQVITTDKNTYSYQICERRNDTIRYRIIRVDGRAKPSYDQVYRLPDIPMAEIDGFMVATPTKANAKRLRTVLVPKKYTFPLALWERMLSYCKVELVRGGLSYEKLYNHYRTVVPRQSINAVYISGGQSVSLDDVPALIVHAAIVAHCDVLLVQRTIKAKTDYIQNERAKVDESTIIKIFRTFCDGIVAIGCLPFTPFSRLPGLIDAAYITLVKDILVTWQPQARVKSLNLALLVNQKQLSYRVLTPTQIDFRQYVNDDKVAGLLDVAKVDSEVAAGLLRVCGSNLTAKYKQRLSTVAGSTTAINSELLTSSLTEKPGQTYYQKGIKKVRRTVMPERGVQLVVQERRLAIKEAIHESEVETRALTATCQRIYREVIVSGKPNEYSLNARREENYNPDLWRVRNGVLLESVLNKDINAPFAYSGVYVPIPDSVGSYLVPVFEDSYSGLSSANGKEVDRSHLRIPVDYTGYVLVLDGLKIFNGPAIVDTMQRALAMDDHSFMYKVTCHQGPPGCGKTTAVAKDGDPSVDYYLVPTRIAMQGLRSKLLENHKVPKKRVDTVCRTLDSLLANYHRLSGDAKQLVTKLLVDEYVLAPSGKWHAAAVLLGVSEMHAYGDFNQISHKPRVEVNNLYTVLTPDILEEEFITFRCAPKILAMFNSVYNNQIRSANNSPATISWVSDVSQVQWMPNCRALTMYQADKKVIYNMLSHLKPMPIISTTHEGQGSDCDQVVLFNFEARKRDSQDSFYLYWKQEYALVALSRCRVSFYYVKMSREKEMVTQMIENADNLITVQNCSDLSTQGEGF